MSEPYVVKKADTSNPGYVVITVRNRDYSIPAGLEQTVADEIAHNLDGG